MGEQMPDLLWAGFARNGEFVLAHPDRSRVTGVRVVHTAGYSPAVEHVSPSVRLVRWLDADPERTVYVTKHDDGLWSCTVFPDGRASGINGRGWARDAALSAALDQAEGVRDAGH